MKYKRATLLCGHYGSGKTNIAVNMAFDIRRTTDRISIADLDIVNPYFRTKDSARELEAAGIELICSEYANTNLDIPALPQEMYSVCDDKSRMAVIDVGGDDRGAYALGRYAPSLVAENNFDMLMVTNFYRPLSRTPEDVIGIMNEISAACGMPFTGIINNSNLGEETTAQDVIDTVPLCETLSNMTGLPVVMTTAEKRFTEQLQDKVPGFFPLTLQYKIS